MVANSVARPRAERDEQVSQTSQRTWARNVTGMLSDEADLADRPRRQPGTQQLHAVPAGFDATSFGLAAVPSAPAYERIYRPRAQARIGHATGLRTAFYMLGAFAAVVILYMLVSSLLAWTQVKLDDMTYGNPRTTHLDAVIGNGDSAAQPTHFIALNLNRQVSVLELPGGDISKAVAISGPYLFGDGEDLTPVKLRVEDINGDGKPDLLLTVKNEEIAYINDKGTFRPITADEKAKIEQANAPAAK